MRLGNVISDTRPNRVLPNSPKDEVLKKASGVRIADCVNRPVPTIFHEHWWLDTTSLGNYKVAMVISDKAIVGWMPYIYSKKRTGQYFIAMPAMTHVLGPALTPNAMAISDLRSLRQFKIIRDLIEQLPNVSHTQFQLHGSLSDTLAFDAAGFTTSVGYTTEIAPDIPEKLWREMRDKTRNVIRRAEEQLVVREDNDPDKFIEYYESNLHKRGLINEYRTDMCKNVIEQCLKRDAGRILSASNKNGEVLASIFTIWDEYKEYYYMTSRRLNATNGAASLLIWTALQHAAARGLTFDSDGLDKNNFTLLTGFGGRLRGRYTVHRSSKLFRIAKFMRDVAR